MKRYIVLLTLLGLAACDLEGDPGPAGDPGPPGDTGTTGPQGPSGGGLYDSRDDVYCNEALLGPTSTAVGAECLTLGDLPLSGGCSASGSGLVVDHVTLNQSQPMVWDDPTWKAQWQCVWSANGWPGKADGTILSGTELPNATATICCIRAAQ